MSVTYSERRNYDGVHVRMKEIISIRTSLESGVDSRKRLSKLYKRMYNSLHYVAIWSTGPSATLAGVALGFRTNPIALIPLNSVNVGLAGIGTLSGFCSKLVVKPIREHDKLELFRNNELDMNNKLIGKLLVKKTLQLMNSRIYQMIIKNIQCIRRSKNIKHVFIERTFAEKV